MQVGDLINRQPSGLITLWFLGVGEACFSFSLERRALFQIVKTNLNYQQYPLIVVTVEWGDKSTVSLLSPAKPLCLWAQILTQDEAISVKWMTHPYDVKGQPPHYKWIISTRQRKMQCHKPPAKILFRFDSAFWLEAKLKIYSAVNLPP